MGFEIRIPIPVVAKVSGISSDALRMRARRSQIPLRREGRVVTVGWTDIERLTAPATMRPHRNGGGDAPTPRLLADTY